MLTVLSKNDIEAIHGATMEVLDRTGVKMDSPEALKLLQEHGCEVDEKTKTVRMNEAIVMDAVKSCHGNFRWHGRSEKDSFDVVNGKTKFGPGAQCLYYIDPDTGEFRHSTLQDGIRICRLLDALDTCSLGYVPVYPTDVPDGAMSPIMWVAGLVNTSKPTYGGWGDDAEFELMLRVAEALLGDRELVRKKTLFPAYIDPVSPLGHDQYMTQTLLRYAQWDIPVFVMVMALAGGTAPASLAGLLVQQNAEILSAVVTAKCVTKRPKIIYGSVSCPLDMRSGIAATGSPEFSLLGVGAVQMAKSYGLPSDMGIQSDSKTVDAQTTYEKTQAALMAVMSGADFAELFMGSTEAFNAFSPLQLMIDDEIASNVQRIARGIEVNDETLSVGVIGKTGPLGNFLKQKETLTQFKKQHMIPKLSDRATRQQWTSSGSKDSLQRAKERMRELLRTHEPEPLDPDVARSLEALVKEYTKEYDLGSLARTGPVR
ncbi:MAG: trimethylamine methyltransferase family protein [Thermoplasmata archaeon]|jgi:trimethylamine--corrinoid protein Co-methyltransferase|nr:trimethylamine methyltransferase family protein [Thermoplasmata archaeon]